MRLQTSRRGEPLEIHQDGLRPGGVFRREGNPGPQSAGLLLGRKDLIAAARLNGPPNSDTVGRGMKVNKEEMLGMMVALDLYVKKNHEQERREFDKRADTIQKSATGVPG